MDPFKVERLVYDGSDPSDDWIITGVGHSKLNMNNVNILPVNSYTDYIGKCPLHDDCEGHICKSPSGVTLPPQTLAIDTLVIRNDIARSALLAFQSDTSFHKNKSRKTLLDSMKTKTGRMRSGILNCHVDGSLRMVITPHQLDDYKTVFIPNYLMDKWKVVRFDEDTQKYVSGYVKHGDRAIALRPPTLRQESVQPVIISFWDKTCVGISPELLKAFKGDYDGDEMHFYPVYSKDAIEECDAWVNTPNSTFNRGRDKYNMSVFGHDESHIMSFIEHSTLSFKQIRDGIDPPLMAEESRTRMEHINGLRKRFDTKWCDENFIEDSIRGMADTNKQQLSQPIVGDMSRIARIAASCIVQSENGDVSVVTEDDTIKITNMEVDDNAGNTAIRAISTICAASQQSALDSHRAKDDKLPAHDLISDLIIGSKYTFVIISKSREVDSLRKILKPQWISAMDGFVFCLCEPRLAARLHEIDILGTYNPKVLSRVHSWRRIEVCHRAITYIVKYHSLPLTDVEIKVLSAMYCFRPDASLEPITTRSGIASRKLHWLDVTMANHYTGLIERTKKGNIPISPITTASSALVAGNFRCLR